MSERRTNGSASEPPRHCPTCGQDLSEHPYYQRGLSRPAKLLRRVAVWMLPLFAALYLVQLFWGEGALGFGTGAGYYAVAWIGGPSMILYALSRLFARTRIVICQRCSWNQEYPPSRVKSASERKAA